MKIIAKCDESQRAPRGFGASFPIPNLSTSTIKNSEYFDLPRELENETLEKKGENKSAGRGREMEAPSTYLTGLLHNSSFTLKYFESNHINEGVMVQPKVIHPMATAPFMG
jgi:hypothetical protein